MTGEHAPATYDKPTKAVILARGLGTRMRKESQDATLTEEQAQVADQGVKAMISVGRPFLDYVISGLADAGFTDVCLVIGPEHDMIRDYYDSQEKRRVNISYAIQEEPLGTGNAVLAAEEFAGDDRVLVINSDNYYPVEGFEKIRQVPGSGLIGFERQSLLDNSNIAPERIAAFALAVANDRGELKDFVEKPSEETIRELGEDGKLSMNLWLFTPKIFEAARKIDLSPRGEYELGDAVAQARAEGETFTLVPLSAGVLDLSNRDDIASVKDALADVPVTL